MHINKDGLELIKSFEGCRLKAYKLQGEKYYTIGYGHSFDNDINADTVWTMAQAESVLKKDLERFEIQTEYYLKAYAFTLNENQFSAIVSYCYNRGVGGLRELLANSKIENMADNIVKYWGSAERYKTGLIKRRKAERDLFLKEINITLTDFEKKEIKKIISDYINGKSTNKPEWKINGEKFLRDMKLITSEHNPCELLDIGTFGIIMKNFMENYSVNK